MFTVELEGFEGFARALRALPDRVLEEGAAGLKRELQPVFEESQALCPVLTGALKASGGLSDPMFGAGQVAFTISYGGDNGELHYALLQHERLDYGHREGQTAKFVERPLMDWSGSGPQRALSGIGDVS